MANTFGDALKEIRISRDMSQDEFSALLGTTKQVISRYENNLRTPKITVAKEYADILMVPLAYLLCDEEASVPILSNILQLPKTYKVPLVGTIACGKPIAAIEEADETVDVPEWIHADFALRCQGDSMINARIFDGDIVYIKSQPMVENGEIAAVRIDDEATLKRVRLYDDRISLEAENPMYKPIVIWGEDMNNVVVLGKAVAFTSAIL